MRVGGLNGCSKFHQQASRHICICDIYKTYTHTPCLSSPDLTLLQASMPPRSLRGVNTKPAARAAMKRLLLKRPAATGVLLRSPASKIKEHWPVVGFPNYSFTKMEQPVDRLGFFGIGFQLRKRSIQKRKRKGRPAFGRPLRLDKELMLSFSSGYFQYFS